jgi:hypothetical protein
MEIARKASRRKPKHIRRDNWNPQSGARTARGANYGKSIAWTTSSSWHTAPMPAV